MKIYLVSDNIDTLVGMRLAGVEGCVVHGYDETVKAIDEALKAKDLGVLLVTEKIADMASEYIRKLKLTLNTPLITQIPDRHGRSDVAQNINSLVSESIGLKL